jgi:hypothetical protein
MVGKSGLPVHGISVRPLYSISRFPKDHCFENSQSQPWQRRVSNNAPGRSGNDREASLRSADRFQSHRQKRHSNCPPFIAIEIENRRCCLSICSHQDGAKRCFYARIMNRTAGRDEREIRMVVGKKRLTEFGPLTTCHRWRDRKTCWKRMIRRYDPLYPGRRCHIDKYPLDVRFQFSRFRQIKGNSK